MEVIRCRDRGGKSLGVLGRCQFEFELTQVKTGGWCEDFAEILI